jgi:hypothetical protein
MPTRTPYVTTEAIGDVMTKANFDLLSNAAVAYNTVSTSQTGISGTTQITNLGVTFTAQASRFYLIVVQLNVNNPTSTGFVKVLLRNATPSTLNCVAETTFAATGTNVRANMSGFYISMPSAGSVTYNAWLVVQSGTVDTAVGSDPGDPGIAWILALEIGPAF